MKTSFDYKEYLDWVNKVNISKEEFDIWLKTFLLQQAQRVVALAKERTPVDTGALRASYAIGGQEIALDYFVDDNGKEHFSLDQEHSQVADISMVGDDLIVEIWNPMEYASFVEYGHHNYMGRYMLTLSVEEVRQALPARFSKQFTEWLKSKGVVP